MADETSAIQYVKFLTSLITTLRQINIYPVKHPIIVNSIKNVWATLNDILAVGTALDMSLSPDGKLQLNGEAVGDKNTVAAQDFVPYFKKLEVEDLIFQPGVTEAEIDLLIKTFAFEAEKVRTLGDINKYFQENGISHIQAKQFAYLKVEKGKEAFVAEGKKSDYDELKEKLKNLTKDKLDRPEDAQQIEREIFSLAVAEYKESRKFSAQVKTIIKKFILHSKEKDDAFSRLRAALLECGCPADEVDTLINKISDEITRAAQPKPKAVSAADVEQLRQENEDLRSQLAAVQQEAGRHSAAVEQLKKENKKILGEKQRVDNIIHNLAEGMVVVDADGRIILVNSAAESILGVTKQDIGKNLKDVVKDEHLLTLTKNFAVEKEGVVEKDIEFVSSDESTKKVLRTSSAVVEDPNGNTVGMVTMLNDITKQKEIENLKSQFLSTVSHELRTPLVAIEKSVSLILSKSTGEISDTQNQFLSIAERNLKRLSLLINDLLDLSKLEAQKMSLDLAPVDVGAVIHDTIETLNTWATTKSVTLRQEVAPDLPAASADANRLIQVLTNLVGNAIKFTPAGGTITVTAVLEPEQKRLRLSVRDTGAGISPEDAARIFEKFYQAKERTATDISGTGIGLAIVKEIVELHRGTVWVESQKGEGANFIFTLPLGNQTEDKDHG